jgi:hypothetical protein
MQIKMEWVLINKGERSGLFEVVNCMCALHVSIGVTRFMHAAQDGVVLINKGVRSW